MIVLQFVLFTKINGFAKVTLLCFYLKKLNVNIVAPFLKLKIKNFVFYFSDLNECVSDVVCQEPVLSLSSSESAKNCENECRNTKQVPVFNPLRNCDFIKF
jgi:hypothetical protein